MIELAATAEKALRENDIVARYGGEEFVIYLDKVNADKAKIVAERLRESMAAIVVYSDEGEEVRFTVSIGLSSSEVSDNVETLLKPPTKPCTVPNKPGVTGLRFSVSPICSILMTLVPQNAKPKL